MKNVEESFADYNNHLFLVLDGLEEVTAKQIDTYGETMAEIISNFCDSTRLAADKQPESCREVYRLSVFGTLLQPFLISASQWPSA